MEQVQPMLTPLFQQELGREELGEYLRELASVATTCEVRVKGGPTARSAAAGHLDLATAADALLAGRVAALQLVYSLPREAGRSDVAYYCDTLLRARPDLYRLVRRTVESTVAERLRGEG
jgi:hypothetical protein